MRNGVASELPTWEQRTTGSASFSSPLYPTPAASDWKRDDYPADRLRKSPNLPTVSHYFKTPTSQLAVNGGSQHPDKRKAGGHGPTLADEIEHLLPTPAAQEPGFTMEPVDKHGNRPTHGAQRWYSPETGRLLQKGVSQVILNLMHSPGETTPPQSTDGNESTDQLPGQQNLLDEMADTA
jgi:hypothetical protein